MRLATCEESRRIDELTQKDFGVAGEVLMEAAGALAAREILQSFVAETRLGGVAVICGPGNNGGDGLVVARHLVSAGVRDVCVFHMAPPEKQSALFRLQLERVKKSGIPTVDLSRDFLGDSIGPALEQVRKRRLVVDALFGIGLQREIKSPYREIVESLNQLSAPVVSLDTPSGLDADRGVALGGLAVKAAQTITFGLAKPGFFISDGPSFTGRLKILPIGFPQEVVKREAQSCFAFTETLARRFLPKRKATSNKASNGHSLLIAGGPGMWGAALLASSSAYRIGSGYVTLASSTEPIDVLKTYPEILTATLDDEKLWQRPKWNAVGIGPGLGTNDEAQEKIANVLDRLQAMKAKSVVLDADAITLVAKRRLWPLPETWCLTPHAGELSRILNVDAKEIESDRVRYAREAASKLGCHVLLKGFRTVLASGSGPSRGRCWIILSGNSALAKAGTGDVLTGMTTGLMAQGLPTLKALATASYIHGRIADEWVRSGESRSSLQASDLRDVLPSLMSRL